MLTRTHAIGERVQLIGLGVGSYQPLGTIINMNAELDEYRINWDDGQFSGEWYRADELEDVSSETTA